jgi:hypothetical protein
VQRNPRVAIVIDDLASVDLWRPRMIEVRGEADVLPTGGDTVGRGFDPPMFDIPPKRVISIGIEGEEAFGLRALGPLTVEGMDASEHSPDDFDAAYVGTPPWDIGRPQTAFQ